MSYITKMSEDALERVRDRIGARWGRFIACSEGWHPIIIQLDKDLSEIFPQYEIHQVKEKFGGLDFHWDRGEGTSFEAANPRPSPPRLLGLEWKERTKSEEWEAYTQEVEEWKDNLERWSKSEAGRCEIQDLEERMEEANCLVKAAKLEAAKTCEECSKPGHLTVHGGWYKTLCEECAAKAEASLVRKYHALSITQAASAKDVASHLKEVGENIAEVGASFAGEVSEEYARALLSEISRRRFKTALEWGEDPTVTLELDAAEEEAVRVFARVAQEEGLLHLLKLDMGGVDEWVDENLITRTSEDGTSFWMEPGVEVFSENGEWRVRVGLKELTPVPYKLLVEERDCAEVGLWLTRVGFTEKCFLTRDDAVRAVAHELKSSSPVHTP